MILDKTFGAIIIVVSIIWHLYYTIWILVTPWLETSQDLVHYLKYFPDRYYGIAIPALLLVLIITSATTFVGAILQNAGLHHRAVYTSSKSSSKHSSKGRVKTLHFSPRSNANSNSSTRNSSTNNNSTMNHSQANRNKIRRRRLVETS